MSFSWTYLFSFQLHFVSKFCSFVGALLSVASFFGSLFPLFLATLSFQRGIFSLCPWFFLSTARSVVRASLTVELFWRFLNEKLLFSLFWASPTVTVEYSFIDVFASRLAWRLFSPFEPRLVSSFSFRVLLCVVSRDVFLLPVFFASVCHLSFLFFFRFAHFSFSGRCNAVFSPRGFRPVSPFVISCFFFHLSVASRA